MKESARKLGFEDRLINELGNIREAAHQLGLTIESVYRDWKSPVGTLYKQHESSLREQRVEHRAEQEIGELRKQTKLIYWTLVATIAIAIISAAVALYNTRFSFNLQSEFYKQQEAKFESQYAFSRAISWAASGRAYSLRELDLSGRNLDHLDLGKDPSDPEGKGADLTEASLADAHLYKTDFDSALLVKADLSGAFFSFSDLTEADFSNANLRKISIYDSNLSGAQFVNTNLSEAMLWENNLRGTLFYKADLSNAVLSYSDLSHASLLGSNLTGAILYDVNLTETNLSEVIYDDDTQWPEGFTPPDSAKKVDVDHE